MSNLCHFRSRNELMMQSLKQHFLIVFLTIVENSKSLWPGFQRHVYFIERNPVMNLPGIPAKKEFRVRHIEINQFPVTSMSAKTVLVLKQPKTESSIRKIYLPRTVAEMLKQRKKFIDSCKEFLGDDYHDYGLVVCYENGTPMEGETITKSFKKMIKRNNLKPVVFHSLRHSSTTYKQLKAVSANVEMVREEMNTLLEKTADFSFCMTQCLWMALFFVLDRLFHAASTTMSHKATFEVLANIRRRLTKKLASVRSRFSALKRASCLFLKNCF